MLKQLLLGSLATLLAISTLPLTPAVASEPLIIDNILDLCLNVQSHGSWFNDANDCSIYSKTQTSVVMDNRLLYIHEPIVLKDLDITFVRKNLPFVFLGDGSLAIDGGHYTSPSCVLWMILDHNESTPVFYNRITVNSGVFTATSENTTSDTPASPVCLIAYDYDDEQNDYREIIESYLPDGKMFVEQETSTKSLRTASGFAHISKDYKTIDGIRYLTTRSVAVVDRPTEPTPDPETTKTPEIVETPETSALPKAPKTGRH
ncbi:hypothetical protein IKE71_00365 [Candidatus Saccharibacteria bacterium]|nr:hypothetical protein [Candidatus Saccharibacteria bacterium]